MKVRTVVAATGLIAAGLGLAAPAAADPGNDPCPLAISLMCQFVPIAPDLDHDIDLTKGPGIINGQTLPEMPSGGSAPLPGPPA